LPNGSRETHIHVPGLVWSSSHFCGLPCHLLGRAWGVWCSDPMVERKASLGIFEEVKSLELPQVVERNPPLGVFEEVEPLEVPQEGPGRRAGTSRYRASTSKEDNSPWQRRGRPAGTLKNR
jgi:hypothetical protein